MDNTLIDFSAQFGGDDAAKLLMPHFRALKKASKGLEFQSPFRLLAFILRVDGSVNQYGPPRISHMDINKRENYVSLDLGITENEYIDFSAHTPSVFICNALVYGVEFLRGSSDARVLQIDFNSLVSVIGIVREKYIAQFNEIQSSSG